jgi:hypothetical protein
MSDEQLNDAPVSEAPVADTPVQGDAQPSAQSSTGSDFGTPYEAFRHLPDFQGQDDLTIAQNLYKAYSGYGETQRQLQQYQSLIPHTTEYMRNAAEYEKWKAAQAEAAKPKPQEAPKWWNPPQVKDTWRSFIVRDPQTGKEVIAPDAPFEAQQALREYQSYTADFARKLVTDPENTLKPFVEQVAIQKAQEMVQNHLNQYKTQNYVSDLERQNADWLYDQNGQPTREGQAISQYIAQAQELGIQTPEARWKYATGMLQRDLLNMRYQQMQSHMAQGPAGVPAPAPAPAAPADPVAQQNMQFLRDRATRTPNRSAGTTEPRAPRARMSFEDRLKSQLVNDGVI